MGLVGFKGASLPVKTHPLAIRDDDAYPWIALGDSFSTGPGAGPPYDDEIPDEGCYRNKGAYAPQLADDFPFDRNGLHFLSCTAAVID